MRIAFISDRLCSGGKERRLIALIQGLLERGNISPVIILWDGIDEQDAIDYKYVLNLNIPIYYLGSHTRVRNCFEVYKILKREQIDAISFWAPPLYSYFMLYSQFRLRIPLYNSSLTNGRNNFTKLELIIGHHIYHFATVVNSNSNQALEVFNIPQKKRKVIYNGFDFTRLINMVPVAEIRKRFKIDTRYIISMAGEYSIRKDWITHVRAANLILSQGYDVTFLCMGAGDPSPYESLIKPLYKKFIRFIGRQNIVESIYNASDIVTLSTPGEGISNSILEGMALAKPIVATNGGGTPELVEQNKSGFLTRYQDEVQYANCIKTLLDDSDLRTSMGVRGYQIVKEKFNIDQMIDKFEEMFLRKR